jgi:hypothetical protein
MQVRYSFIHLFMWNMTMKRFIAFSRKSNLFYLLTSALRFDFYMQVGKGNEDSKERPVIEKPYCYKNKLLSEYTHKLLLYITTRYFYDKSLKFSITWINRNLILLLL